MADERLHKTRKYKGVFDGVATAAHGQPDLGRARLLRPSLAQMFGDNQDTRPRPTACGDIRGGLITWLERSTVKNAPASGAFLFCRCGRLLAPSVKTRMQHDGVWDSLMALITNIRARRISCLLPCTLFPSQSSFSTSTVSTPSSTRPRPGLPNARSMRRILSPDMFNLARQVRAATDHAANAAGRLAGVTRALNASAREAR